ncbi:Putative telomere resolvase (plasmid) [Candidatus Bealeia paramacronuclearis]|uniref:Telomere resolvase n=1 Tax=Candidatus Bealeia paramacronuclearis TaxID=1921001 RepID=A0ABZ2C5R1_9PROT|nr:hypothetical protein [Candidatus Bealeia paramacronuclearis]
MSETSFVSPLSYLPPNQFQVFERDLRAISTSEEQILALVHKTQERLRREYPNLKSLRRILTHYRNICRKVLSGDLLRGALGVLNLKDQEIVFLNTNYIETVAQEHRNLRPLQNYLEMIKHAEDLLITRRPLDWVLGLCFLTGRRAAEIGSTACFGVVDADHVRFSGQLKTKTRESRPYVIPVLTHSKRITETLATLRKEKPRWLDDPRYFKDNTSSPLSQKVKKQFGEFILNPRVKDLRAAYAEVAYHRFGSEEIAKSRFFSDILGHGENDIVTGQSYLDFYLAS